MANRFERLEFKPEPYEGEEFDDGPKPSARTTFIRDQSRTILSQNTSPDLPLRWSINPYRGCEHGCAYCYARPSHEYLGFSAGLDFETKIVVKENAADLLRAAFDKPSWSGEPICLSGNTDCYQPVERRLALTRRCLEVFGAYLNPVSLITKNALITRDIDVLVPLARVDAVEVHVSLTTLDDDLCAALEPRTSRPPARLDAIRRLADAGIPVGVNLAPIIPGLTDHEIPTLLAAAARAGAKSAHMSPLRLPLAVAPLFEDWLERFRPLRKSKVLANVRRTRGGDLNDSRFGTRLRGEGPTAELMRDLFKVHARRLGLSQSGARLNSGAFQRPARESPQLSFF